MAKAKAKKPVKRKDGKPTRREKSRVNSGMFHAAQRALKATMNPEPAHARAHTPDDIEAVFEALMAGDTVRNKCRELAVHPGKLLAAIDDDAQLRSRYARAREIQSEVWADDIVADADDAALTIDTEADGANVELGIVKHKFEAKKWLMGKNHIRRFGDKSTTVLEGNPEKPLRTVTSEMDDAEAAAAYQESLRNRPR
jgi:hypothetical protein